MSAKSLGAFLLVVAVVGLLAFGLWEKGDEAIAIGDAAPDAELVELADGAPASLDRYRGRWLLVNFWSSWCPPCRDESPVLESFSDAGPKDRLEVVGINIEDASEDARSFVAEFKLTYPQLRASDSAAVVEDYGITGRPENVLVDPEGRIALIRRGPVDDEFLRRYVDPLVAGSGAAQ